MMRRSALGTRSHQRGVGIVETMVGILIGLVVVVVIYNMLAIAESFKRTATGTADAQITGLVSQFTAGQDVANGGNGLASGYSDLINCRKNEDDSNPNEFTTLKPVPVLITPGVAASDPDSILSRQGGSPHVVWPVPLRPLDAATGTMPAASTLQVQSPNGFMTPAKGSLPTAANPFLAVAIANDGTGRCGLISITDAAPATTPPMDDSGEVKLTQGAWATSIDYKGEPQNSSGTGAVLLNLGRRDGAGSAMRVRYDIVNDQLRTTNCMFRDGCGNVASTPNPIASNVVWMKAQYGIDTGAVAANGTLRGRLDCWAIAGSTDCPIVGAADWSAATVIKAGEGTVPANLLNRIVAVRLAFVIRSDEPDFRNPALYRVGQSTIDGAAGTRQPQWLFNCPANDNTCENRVEVPAPGIMQDGWRYRVYEAVIPLRNSLFAGTIAQ